MKRKIFNIFAILLIISFSVQAVVFAWNKKAQDKTNAGIYEVILDSLKNRQREYASQEKELSKKILKLEKQQIKAKQKNDLERQINSLVVSLADVQYKLDELKEEIKEQEARKGKVGLAMSVESFLSQDAKKAREQEAGQMLSVEEAGLQSAEYRIASHDEVQINVYGEPDLTKTARVASDGTISYPLLGRIKVDGLTSQGLEERLSKLLVEGGYIMVPQVSVYVERFSTISILGEVRNPGSYELKGKLGIMDAIAHAGGFTIDADINNIKVLRTEGTEKKTMQLRLGDVKKGIETTEIVLRPNDTIYVEKIGKVTVLGEVTRPGTFEMKSQLTVLEAVAMAGGFTDVAAINRTRIIRQDPSSKKKIINVRVTDIVYRGMKTKDMELLPGDIIYVPETLF